MGPSLEALARETPGQRRIRRLKKLAWNLLFAAIAYGVIVLGARLLSRRVLYQPPTDEPADDMPEGATLFTTKARDGVTVNAFEFANPKATRTIVHFHGNAETASANASLAREMRKRGFAVILVEYRGYGRSRGVATDEQGVYDDASAVLDALAVRGTTAEHVVLWGQSLGTGIAAEMAYRKRGARLVLVAPFASAVAMAKKVAPFLPSQIVMVDKFDTLAKAPQIVSPTLVVHGDIDDVIPFEQGELVSKALPNATFLKVSEGRHDNLYKSQTVIAAITAHVGG